MAPSETVWVPNPTVWDAPPPGNQWMSFAPAKHVLDIRIGVVPNDRDGLERAVYAMSTPGNPNYGKHMSADEVRLTSCIPVSRVLTSLLGPKLYGTKYY